jgi:hypothetical protein
MSYTKRGRSTIEPICSSARPFEVYKVQALEIRLVLTFMRVFHFGHSAATLCKVCG